MNDYETSDLSYAAYLRTMGVELATTRRSDDGRRVTFVFRWEEELADLRRGWVTGEQRVSAREYAEALRAMKALCFL